MTDVRTLLSDHADRADAQVEPITLDEIRALASTLEVPATPAAATRWYQHRRVPVAAVLTLLALTLTALVALLVTRNDPGTIADQPETTTTTTAAPVPEPGAGPDAGALSLLPQGVRVTIHDAPDDPTDGSVVTSVDQRGTEEEWRRFLGIDPSTVGRVLVWRPASRSALFVIEGDLDLDAVEAALAADPDWASRTTTVEHAGTDVVVREVADDEPPIRTPLQALRSHAIAVVEGAVVVGLEPQVVLDALDRVGGPDTLAAAPGIAELLDVASTLDSPDLRTAVLDAEPDDDLPDWYTGDVTGVPRDAPRQAVVALRVADGDDAAALRERIDENLTFQLLQLANTPSAAATVDGAVVTITATYASRPQSSDLTELRLTVLSAAEQDDSEPWVPIILVLLLVGVATFAAWVDRRNGPRGGRWRRGGSSEEARAMAQLQAQNSMWDGYGFGP